MRLSNGQIRPGRVVATSITGEIKAVVPGLFSDQDEPSLLPPIYPFFVSNENSFSKVNINDSVWVIFFSDNPYELFYFRRNDNNKSLNSILEKEYKKVEVIASMNNGRGSYAQLFFTDGRGWIIRNGDSVISIESDGSIVLDGGMPNRQISIDSNSISLGSRGGSAEPAVLGDKLVDTLNKLNRVLLAVESAANTSPYTTWIAKAISTTQPDFQESISLVKSLNVTLD